MCTRIAWKDKIYKMNRIGQCGIQLTNRVPSFLKIRFGFVHKQMSTTTITINRMIYWAQLMPRDFIVFHIEMGWLVSIYVYALNAQHCSFWTWHNTIIINIIIIVAVASIYNYLPFIFHSKLWMAEWNTITFSENIKTVHHLAKGFARVHVYVCYCWIAATVLMFPWIKNILFPSINIIRLC